MTDASSIPEQIIAIYNQVGGNRAMAMAFSAWSYSSKDTSATFTIAPALRRSIPDGVTHVRVTLDPSDTYRVEFLQVSRAWPAGRERYALAGVHAAELRPLVETQTGLRLTLGAIARVSA